MSNIVGIMGKMTPSDSSFPSPMLCSSSPLGDNCNPANIVEWDLLNENTGAFLKILIQLYVPVTVRKINALVLFQLYKIIQTQEVDLNKINYNIQINRIN